MSSRYAKGSRSTTNLSEENQPRVDFFNNKRPHKRHREELEQPAVTLKPPSPCTQLQY